jgi:hypothetical protein
VDCSQPYLSEFPTNKSNKDLNQAIQSSTYNSFASNASTELLQCVLLHYFAQNAHTIFYHQLVDPRMTELISHNGHTLLIKKQGTVCPLCELYLLPIHTKEPKDVMTSSALLLIQHQCHQVFPISTPHSKFLVIEHQSRRRQFCYNTGNRCFTWDCTVMILPTTWDVVYE